jgi:hypothetical protein
MVLFRALVLLLANAPLVGLTAKLTPIVNNSIGVSKERELNLFQNVQAHLLASMTTVCQMHLLGKRVQL